MFRFRQAGDVAGSVLICRGVPPWAPHSCRFDTQGGAPTEGRPYKLGHHYVALVLLVTFIAANAQAQITKQDDAGSDLASGVLLDRLSARDHKTWRAIKHVIYEEDADGKPVHPMLKTLLEQLQTSDHSVYLEFDDSLAGCRCTAGKFSIERVEREGSRNVAVIKLYLRIIDHASAPSRANLKGGFAPLAGLNKLDRYAEVFGHEMAHAVDVLFSPERVKWVDEVLRKSDQVIQQRLRRKGRIEPEMQLALQERDAFLHELEKPAEIAEAMVWRELVESRRKPTALSVPICER